MKKIKLELTPKQLIALQKMVFIGSMVINGNKIENFDTDVQSAQKEIINTSVKSWNLWYIKKHTEWWYDFWIEKSMELFGTLQEYCTEKMNEDLLEILTENMLEKLWKDESEYDELEWKIDEYMMKYQYSKLYIDLSEIANPLFQK